MEVIPIMRTFFAAIFLLPYFLFAFTSCSGAKAPIEPVNPDINLPDLPESFGALDENRNVLAIYDAIIDPESGTFTITPVERVGAYHFPLTQLYPNVLTITGYGDTPNIWVNFRLSHPFPGSGIDGFDPRVIAILPANPGVRFIYPAIGVGGNNSVVLEPDGYTKLFDNLGGSIPGNVNPFKAYFKAQPYRVWSSTDVTSETQRWNMNFSGFGGPIVFKLVVDVSTKFPNPPTPGTDNAPEPVQIEAFIGQGLTPDGGSAQIDVTLLDWQGQSGISRVLVEAPNLFNGTVNLLYSAPGQNPNEYVYTGTVTNSLLAPGGEYKLLVAALDQATGIYIYNEFDFGVWPEGFNPIDFTPPWLNSSPQDVYIDGNYAYIAGGFSGLQIFDVSNPLNPVWVNWVDTPGFASAVYVSVGYAYVADYDADLQIIDIEPPESAYIIKSVDTPGSALGVHVSGGYAYVADYDSGLQIIDIEPPESAYIVKTVDTPGGAFGVHVSGGYAYVADYDAGLQIIDIEPPGSAYIVKSVDTQGSAFGVHVSGGYAYVTDEYEGLQIIDIDPPSSAYIVKSVEILGFVHGVHVSGGYAYVASYQSGLHIIDIEPLESAYIAKSYYTLLLPYDVYVSNGYACVTDQVLGLFLINVNTPESARIVNRVDVPMYAHVHVTEGYAYLGIWDEGLGIIDIDPPESAHIVNSVNMPSETHSVDVEESYKVIGGYAYLGIWDEGLAITDIDPPESAYIVNIVETAGNADGVDVVEGYVYMGIWDEGLAIVDIEPPETAYVVKTVDTPGSAAGVQVSGGYAYVTDGYDGGLQIIDIEPQESAYIVNSVDIPGNTIGVHVSDRYAYVVYVVDFMDSDGGLRIIKLW